MGVSFKRVRTRQKRHSRSSLTNIRVDADDRLAVAHNPTGSVEERAVATGRHDAVGPLQVLGLARVALADARLDAVFVERLDYLLESSIVNLVVLDEALKTRACSVQLADKQTWSL